MAAQGDVDVESPAVAEIDGRQMIVVNPDSVAGNTSFPAPATAGPPEVAPLVLSGRPSGVSSH